MIEVRRSAPASIAIRRYLALVSVTRAAPAQVGVRADYMPPPINLSLNFNAAAHAVAIFVGGPM